MLFNVISVNGVVIEAGLFFLKKIEGIEVFSPIRKSLSEGEIVKPH